MAIHYLSQTGDGLEDGTSEANAWPASFFNTAGNWSTTPGTPGKISRGDTVTLVGTILTALTVQISGASDNRITILFGAGAKMSAANWGSTGAINLTTKHYITIDGGASGTIGGINGNPAGANGIIECTDNGTVLGTQLGSRGILAFQCSNLTVRNLVVQNIFVRVTGTETGQTGTCVHNEGSAADFTDFIVENCILNHAAKAIHADFNQTSARYTFQDLTITHTNHAIQCGARGSTSLLDGVVVRRNTFSDFENWDGTDGPSQGALHHNGFYAFATTGSSRFIGAEIYDNVFGPGWGGSTTAGVFLVSQGSSVATLYNNVFLGASDAPSNGYVTTGVGDGSVIRIYNNTFAGAAGGIAINGGGDRSSFYIVNSDPIDPEAYQTYIYNNLSINKTFAFLSYGVIATEIDRNLNYNHPANEAYATGSASSASFKTFSQWQALGYDTNGVYAEDPLLTGSYGLGGSSPAIGVGANLSAFFTTDADGNARPAVGAWDLGAFEFVVQTTAALGRRGRRVLSMLSF